MLTDAQYKVLKSWPDGGRYELPDECRALGRFIKAWRRDILGLRIRVYLKRQPACNDAIREYEEAHKERLVNDADRRAV